MGDYGMAVSQKGYDVKTCADRFLVYSSAFQTLKIFNTYSVSTVIPSGSNTNTINITHNLGYYSSFIIVYNGSTTRGLGQSQFMTDGSFVSIDGQQTINVLSINVNGYFDSLGSNVGDTVYFTVYIFLNDFSTISGQTVNTSTTIGSTSSDYGTRISKPGFDVKTCADVNCILSSSFFNQIVHMQGTLSGTSAQIAHNLGYIPNYLNYSISSGNNYMVYNATQGAADSTYFYSQNLTGDVTYYVIFKDKLV